MKTFGTFFLCAGLVSAFLLCGCQKKEEAGTARIGITQITTHPGIDLVRNGFLDEMKVLGYEDGKNVVYDQQNAQGQMPVAQTIAQKFINERVNLVFAITTPSAQAVAKAAQGTGIPLVFGAITDPVDAGLVKNLQLPGGNITGTSDVWPVKKQIELLLTVAPGVKRLGVIFNPGESNSKSNMEMVESACKELKLEVVLAAVSNSSEIYQAAQSLVGRCDAIYASASNAVSEAIQSIVKVSEAEKIPLLIGNAGDVEKGGFGTIGNDYADIGRQSARLADRILKGENAGNIPVALATKYEYFFNLKSAATSGVTIPQDLIDKAVKVYQ